MLSTNREVSIFDEQLHPRFKNFSEISFENEHFAKITELQPNLFLIRSSFEGSFVAQIFFATKIGSKENIYRRKSLDLHY